MSGTFDFAIIGAGVVGCALARELTLRGACVVILEKAPDVLDGASKGNSAILHTGFDAPPGSLEQACIARGYAHYLNLAADLNLPVLKSGALVLAWDRDQQSQLPALMEKAATNGVNDTALLSRDEILEREPSLARSVVGGFKVPGEYLIDPWTTAHAYLLQAIENGAVLSRNAEVTGGKFDGEKWSLDTTAGAVSSRQVINCAGLYGDVVDARLLGEKAFTVTPRKGQFVVFDKTASDLVSAIILPVPTKKTKGIVVCRTIFGNVLVGPTAEDQESRTDASTDRKALLALRDRGVEIFPDLATCEVTTAYAGLRPATEYPDYQIRQLGDKNYVCVGGIRSTGLSGALGIALHVAEFFAPPTFSNPPIKTPVRPTLDRLSDYHARDWQEPDNGGIVCHCELVTRREIEAVMNGPIPPASLQGLKRRTRACMGRCQGFYCTAELAKITKGHFDLPLGVAHEAQ